jgi:hypothetical protein
VALALSWAQDAKRTPRGAPEKAVARCDFHRTRVMYVADTKALGYVNNSKFLIDGQGNACVAVRSKDGGRYNIGLVRSTGAWREGMSFEQTWLEDRPGLEVSTAPQRPAAIAYGADESIHMVWYGGSAADPAHQIRYARFGIGPESHIEEEASPFTVPSLTTTSGVDSSASDLWQEHPSIALGPGGTLHVAWEARDGSRRSKDGTPRPGIAYTTRTRDGVWPATGFLGRPPYLEVDDQYPSQSRPTILVDHSGTVHVLCYGAVESVQQILHGELKNGKFSGWKPISPSAGDQRHVAAALDPEGNLHAVWREGRVPEGGATATVSVFYSAMDPAGSWRAPVRVSGPGENASTPSITASATGVSVAWVAWNPGAINSELQPENGFPSDHSTVEGAVKVASMRYGSPGFDTPTLIDAGPASYPTWAVRAAGGDDPPPLIWTSVEPTAPGRVGLFLGWCAGRSR